MIRQWMLLVFCVAAASSGCMSPIVVPDGDEDTDIVTPDPLPDDDSSPSSIAVTASADAFAEIHQWLGAANTITVKDAMTVERPEVSVNVPAGASVAYSFSDEVGTFTFGKPLPTVKASVLGFKVSPSLSVVTLKPDGSGVAATGLGRYKFRWLADDEDAGVAAVDAKLPEVWAYSQAGCPPCARARLELAAEKDLPFRVIWKDEAAPDWLRSRPAFWWHTTADQPSQQDVNNTRQTTGWNGIRDFVERWKASRSPKRFQRAAVSYNSSHNCPSCGRSQYAIANNSGPVPSSHVHKCGSCGTSWYHADR